MVFLVENSNELKKKETEKASEDIYDDVEEEELMEEDAIEPSEAGFMEGYNNPKDAEHIIENERKNKKEFK